MSLVLIMTIFASEGAQLPVEATSLNLSELAERYCIGPDGDHRLTWTRAREDGFRIITSEEVGDLRLVGTVARDLRAFRKTIDGREFRVLTSSAWRYSPNQGESHYRWCWVSSSRDDVGSVNREIRTLLDLPGFRVEQVRMFAWIPRPDGRLEPVSRRVYLRSGNVLAREQGLRQLTTRRIDDGVSIGYASPRDEATSRDIDWAGPEPVPHRR